LINKTFKQLNAERAARRARHDAAQYGLKLRLKKKQKKNKSASSQAGGPSHKESGFKQVDKSTSSGIK